MGTTYSVLIAELPKTETTDRLKRVIDARLQALNQNLSTWIPDSQLSRFNRSSTTDWVELPNELIQLVKAAADVSRLSGGAYDITVGPVVDLWGFGAGKASTNTIPNEASINDALQLSLIHI